jgi:hypothetical protein
LPRRIALVYRADVGARAAASTTTASKTPSVELRGNVLDVLKTLLAEGQSEAVLALFAKLVSRNSELEARLAKLLSGPRKNEGVSTAQLKLFLESLDARTDEAAGGPSAKAADEKLRAASAIDQKKEEGGDPLGHRKSAENRTNRLKTRDPTRHVWVVKAHRSPEEAPQCKSKHVHPRKRSPLPSPSAFSMT